MSNSLDPDQARRFVRPDLGPNCLQGLSADDKSPLVGKELKYINHYPGKATVMKHNLRHLNKNRFETMTVHNKTVYKKEMQQKNFLV